jgi:hypothetical protein
MSNWWFWLTLLGLGAHHGINPAMGWLFAVALGMQEKSRRAALAAILPIALGHALAIGVVVSLLWLAQKNLPMQAIRYGAAAIGAHSLGFLLAVALIALLVYEKFGLTLLSRAWFNIDWLWVIALMVSGVLILFI